jgi:hypothetical protein
MSVFFMILLFTLNIITIFAVIILYLRQNRFSKLEKQQKAIINEMEELFTGYLLEMKEDNEALAKAFTNAGAIISERVSAEREYVPVMESMEIIEDKLGQGGGSNYKEIRGTNKQSAEAYKNLFENDEDYMEPEKIVDKLELTYSSNEKLPTEKDFSSFLPDSLKELSINEQVDYLTEQGQTVEEIARKLNRGQTEIELLLKFRMKR